MSQSSATKLVSKLKFKLNERRRLSTPEGPVGRHRKIKKTVTALFKHERIELNYNLADESRGYAERLISDAIRHGDCHKPTMEMAKYWITETPIIHKLFKVLAPRYQNEEVSFTKLWRAPNVYPGIGYPKCVLELRNNIYPPLYPDKSHEKNLIHNVLLEAAKKEYRREKAKKAEAEAAAANEQKIVSETDVSQAVVEETSETFDNNNEMSTSEEGSEAQTTENLKADNSSSSNSSESTEKSDVNVSELNVDKINLKEGEQIDSSSNVEKK